MDVGREIAAALAAFAEEDLRSRLRAARAVVDTIPSGTADVNLTPAQAAAIEEYETITAQLREDDDV